MCWDNAEYYGIGRASGYIVTIKTTGQFVIICKGGGSGRIPVCGRSAAVNEKDGRRDVSRTA